MQRLAKNYVGEGMGLDSTTVDRLLGRKNRECGAQITLPVHTDVHWDSHRKIRRVANAGPNAPLLIRLVRYPYVMRPVSMERFALQARESIPEKTPFGEVLRDNAEAWMKPGKHRPAKGRLRLVTPSRLDADAWLGRGER